MDYLSKDNIKDYLILSLIYIVIELYITNGEINIQTMTTINRNEFPLHNNHPQ